MCITSKLSNMSSRNIDSLYSLFHIHLGVYSYVRVCNTYAFIHKLSLLLTLKTNAISFKEVSCFDSRQRYEIFSFPKPPERLSGTSNLLLYIYICIHTYTYTHTSISYKVTACVKLCLHIRMFFFLFKRFGLEEREV